MAKPYRWETSIQQSHIPPDDDFPAFVIAISGALAWLVLPAFTLFLLYQLVRWVLISH